MRRILQSVGLTLVLCCAVFIYSAFVHAERARSEDALFQARLSVVPIDSSMQVDVTGRGQLSAELAGRVLRINGSFEGLQGAATVARLHMGSVTGVRGAPFADLVVERAAGGWIAALLQLSPQQVDALHAGRVYVQLHSERAPEGNLWGWLLR